MQAAFDLFGDIVETTKNSKPNAQVAPNPRAKVMLDRCKIWGEGGYLATLDDGSTSIHTTKSYTENATIERLENALFMTPLLKNGEWVIDDPFYAYKLTKSVLGPREFGVRGTLFRDATQYMLQASARRVLEETFKEPEAWLPRWAYWLFCHRLRKAGDNEDPYELLKAFTAVMTQFDYLEETRKGDTMRTLIKRHRMQSSRSKCSSKGAALDNDAYVEADDNDDAEANDANANNVVAKPEVDDVDEDFFAEYGDERIIDIGDVDDL